MASIKVCQALIHVPRRSRRVCTATIRVVPPPKQATFTVLRNSEENGFGGLNIPEGYAFSSWAEPPGATVAVRAGRLVVYTPPIEFSGTQQIQLTLTAYNKPDIPLTITVNVVRRNLSVVFDHVFVLRNSSANILALSHNDVGEGRRIIAASVDIGAVALTAEGVEYTPPTGYIGPPATITYSISNSQGD